VLRPDPVSGSLVEAYYEDHVCGQVDIMISGHDHDRQWLEPPPDCPGVDQNVSGAASKTREAANVERNPAYFQQYSTLGFMWIEATEDRFTGIFFDGDATLLFERSLTKESLIPT
jgi:tartrate-resistant acid phosphatase type 5